MQQQPSNDVPNSGTPGASARSRDELSQAPAMGPAIRASLPCVVVPDSLSIGTSPTAKAPLLSVKVKYLSGSGAVTREAHAIFLRNPEDVLSVLGFNPTTKKFVVGRGPRPALLARTAVDLPLESDAATGAPIGVVGGYLTIGINHTASQILRQKLLTTTPLHAMQLGSSVITNARDSIEVDTPMIAIVDPDEAMLSADSEDIFQRGRSIVELSATEIINRIYGENIPAEERISDARLLVYLERALAIPEIRVRLETLPTAPDEICRFIETARARSRDQLASNAPEEEGKTYPRVTTLSDIRELLRPQSLARTGRKFLNLNISDAQPVSERDGIAHYEGKFSVPSLNNSPGRDESAFECIVPKADRLLTGIFTEIGGEVHVLLTVGVRASLEYRRSECRSVQNLSSPTFFEAPFIEVGPDVLSQGAAGLSATARQYVGELLAIDPTAIDVLVTPAQLFPSSGFSSRAFKHALCFVPAALLQSACKSPDFALVSLKDLVQAHDEGSIQSLETNLTTSLLTLSVPEQDRPTTAERPSLSPEAESLSEALLKDDGLPEKLLQHCPGAIELLKSEPLFHHLMFERGNLGGFDLHSSNEHPGVSSTFFSSNWEHFIMHVDADPVQVLQLSVHDGWHYSHPDRLPKNQIYPEYATPIIETEAQAVTISDVLFPIRFGVEKVEASEKRGSLAGLLIEAGIVSRDTTHASAVQLKDAYTVIHQAIAHGTLDPRVKKILLDPTREPYYRSIVQERMIGYHVRDTLKNIAVLYKHWRDHPQVLEVAARFQSHSLQRPLGFMERIAELVGNSEQVTSSAGTSGIGFNILAARASGLMRRGLYLPALRLAQLKEHKDFSQKISSELGAEAHRLVEELEANHREASLMVGSIQNLNFSPENIRLAKAMTRVIALEQRARGVADLIARTLLNEQQLKLFLENPFSPFPTILFNPLNNTRMLRIIKQKYEAALKPDC